ncbi:HNH endonuclease family protein [Corynebacterium pseudotuberculosis]|uniref:DUF1524 domain-containing protein n=1 Tax=Corynebacterium pseudotuberculosis 258 TaxID=1168865 RepID=A0AAU8Q4A0_CORPS|nr:HNH endonuclease family protein [Corynebacterium pseudotuberculosis]AEQ06372.1 DUF1524 domain-containing protein [Corynebacterium pseudotuberculosis CIP 52.97]AFH90641.1 DUF1524 domain-containing protein [Corynebacterium pseudotuberculosis 31]AFK16457.1 DUF1524 domain-containing protein [Corynebacterium pseudotuberculosis 258]AKS13161.1 Hypothetical protein CpE19_0821 [Corynebacterium pseudotuberculosis]APB10743.1 hypothetical protein A4R72_04375 [Corynebacterium pseudotuberculosis]
MRRILSLLVTATLLLIFFTVPLSREFADLPTVKQRTTVLGYKREYFGATWGIAPHSKCSTRVAVLAATLNDVHLTASCSLSSGWTLDPYSGRKISVDGTAAPIELDHVFPLAAAWDMGAHAWSAEQRLVFANDPLNLVVASKEQNQQKSDKLPSEWLPVQRSHRCWYVRRLAEVARKYQLPLSKPDVSVMHRQC